MVEKRRRLWLLSFSSKLPNPYAMFDHKKIKVHQKPRLLRVCPECGYGHYESRVSCVPPPPILYFPHVTSSYLLTIGWLRENCSYLRETFSKLFVSSRNFFKIIFLLFPVPLTYVVITFYLLQSHENYSF